jgi:hypothetical protein
LQEPVVAVVVAISIAKCSMFVSAKSRVDENASDDPNSILILN